MWTPIRPDSILKRQHGPGKQSLQIPPGQDVAQIGRRDLGEGVPGRRPDCAACKGLRSVAHHVRAVAVTPDGRAVEALKFYEHGETRGSAITRPAGMARQICWQTDWVPDGGVALGVAEGRGCAHDSAGALQVDGITGATL